MSIRFIEDNLEKDGKILEISFEVLVCECLKHAGDSYSVREIVFSTIEKMTQDRVSRDNHHRKSSLFNRIEAEIIKSPQYIRVREQKEKERKIMEGDKEEIIRKRGHEYDCKAYSRDRRNNGRYKSYVMKRRTLY